MQANSWHLKLFHFNLFFWIWKVWKGIEKIKKIEHLEKEKSFLDEIKTFFTVFEGLSFGEKIKIWEKIVGTSFKDKIFPLYHKSRFENKDEDEDEFRDENGLINYQKLDRLIFLKET